MGCSLGKCPFELRDHDALVEIHAAGVNPLDSNIRDGEFKLIFALSFTPHFGQ